jgi:hypothetical protein
MLGGNRSGKDDDFNKLSCEGKVTYWTTPRSSTGIRKVLTEKRFSRFYSNHTDIQKYKISDK